jgi:hypothetical protein
MPVAVALKPREFCYEVIQDGVVVASAWSRNEGQARMEAAHYAAMYAQDGPVELRLKAMKRKRKD